MDSTPKVYTLREIWSYGRWARPKLKCHYPYTHHRGTVTTPQPSMPLGPMTSGSLPNLKPGKRLFLGPGLAPLSSSPVTQCLGTAPKVPWPLPVSFDETYRVTLDDSGKKVRCAVAGEEVVGAAQVQALHRSHHAPRSYHGGWVGNELHI